MKMINKTLAYLSALAVSLIAVSCVSELTAEVGAPDNENCYGIYFPSQEGTGDHQVGPDDPKTFTFKVRRTNTRGRLEVPVTIDASHDGVFTATEIVFEEDAPTAELTVHFPTIKLGEKYECTILVEGDEYVSSYSQNASHLSFSVTCVKWNKLVGENGETTGKWRDGVFAEWFNLAYPNLEQSVVIYERDDLPGYYRIYDVYNSTYMSNMFQLDASSVCLEKHWTYIDATDPEKVWIPTFKTGIVMNAEYGEMSIASYVVENEEFDPSISSIYGKLEDGIITFPASALQLHFALLGWYPSNSYGLHRIILPGYREMEHDIDLSVGITNENGVLPVEVKIGQDVAKLMLHTLEGTVSGSAAASLAEDLAAGRVEPNLDEMTGSGNLELVFDETGTYSIVAVAIGEDGTLVNYAYESFGYKKSGDEKEIVLNYGLISSNKYAPDGMTEKNSLEIYINGEDIKRLHVGLYEMEKYEKNKEQYLKSLENAQLNEENLALVNGSGLSLVQSGLVPGTEYVLVMKAYNGYSEETFEYSAYTGGDWDYRLAYYTSDDIDPDVMFNVLSAADYHGTYNYYAMEASSSRSCLGEVVIEASNTTYQGQTCVKISGLFPFMRKTYNVEDDSMDFYFYNGYIWNYKLRSEYFIFEGMYVYMSALMYESGGSAYGGQGGLLGAYVTKQGKAGAKTCIAMMDSGVGASQGLAFEGLAVLGYEDSNHTSSIGLLDLVESIVLVPKASDPDPIIDESKQEAEQSAMNTAGLKLLDKMAARNPFRNLVETDEGMMMSIIDDFQSRENVQNFLDMDSARIIK